MVARELTRLQVAAFDKYWRLFRNAPKRNTEVMGDKSIDVLRRLYPHLPDQQLIEAEENLERYFVLRIRIFERMQSEAVTNAARLTPGNGTLRCTPPEKEVS